MTKYRIIKTSRNPYYEIRELAKNINGDDYWRFITARSFLWEAKLKLKKIIKEEKNKLIEPVVVYEVEA